MTMIGRALAVVLLMGTLAGAGEEPAVPGAVVVELVDGGRLVGHILEEDASRIRLRTNAGLELDVPRDAIASMRAQGEAPSRPARLDPNYSRLMFGPTGRPLRKGDGYFSDYELFFPGVAVGLTDNLSLAGGMSVIPGLGLTEQVLYISPRLGHQFTDRFAASVGGLYATLDESDAGDRESLGILFGVATFGGRARSLTAGVGLAVADDVRTPIVMLGGTASVSRHVALVSENWLVLDEDFELGSQPLAAAVRFFGERLSADVGVVVIPEYLEDGGFFPWVSVSYHFGPSRGESRGWSPIPVHPKRR